jgi:hypothetical protein
LPLAWCWSATSPSRARCASGARRLVLNDLWPSPFRGRRDAIHTSLLAA